MPSPFHWEHSLEWQGDIPMSARVPHGYRKTHSVRAMGIAGMGMV